MTQEKCTWCGRKLYIKPHQACEEQRKQSTIKPKHVHGRPDNESQHLDDLLGRGKGDPDVHGYPNQEPNIRSFHHFTDGTVVETSHLPKGDI